MMTEKDSVQGQQKRAEGLSFIYLIRGSTVYKGVKILPSPGNSEGAESQRGQNQK